MSSLPLQTAPPEPAGASLPPRPATRFWGLSHLWAMRKDLLGCARRIQQQYPDAAYIPIGPEHTFEFFHPDWVRQILVEKADSFGRWERFVQVMEGVMGKNVLVTDGAVWQRQRHLLQPGFANRRMAGYASMMAETTDHALRTLAVQSTGPMNIEQAMTQLTMQVIMRTLFSHAPQADSPQVTGAGDAINILNRIAHKAFFRPFDLPDWLPHKAKKRRAARVLDDLIWQEIRRRQHDIAAGAASRGDLLDMLLSARDEEATDPDTTSPASNGLSEQEVRDQCMTMFLAGHDTTAAALTWWCWLMASHPEHAQRASDEVDAALGQRLPGHDDMGALPYLGQTLREAMRLYPPAPLLVTRRALEPVQIGPWTLPKGAMVRITPWVMHHDPRWFPEPEAFKPERFEAAAMAQLPRGAYMPFGAGPRVCIASQFATMEMTLVAAMLLQRFRLATLPGRTPEPEFNVTFRSKNGVYVSLTPRHQALGGS